MTLERILFKKKIQCEIIYWRDTQLKLDEMDINHIYISKVWVLREKVEDCQNKIYNTTEREAFLNNKIQIKFKCYVY